MYDIDMIIAQIEDGKVTVKDYWSTSLYKPYLDTIQDVSVINQFVLSNGYSVTFKRKLNTGDS